MSIRHVAKAVVTNESGQVLLLRRSEEDTTRPGDWDFPGGGVEDGEDFRLATVREVAEEIGITIRPEQLRLIYIGTEFWEPDDITYFRSLYALPIEGTPMVVLSSEHDSYQWMDVEEALSKFTHVFYNAGLRYAYEHGLLLE